MKNLLGQHFLRCQWVIDTLIKVSELKKSDTILEIGPGTGILTKALAKKAEKVIAVEKDKELAAELGRSLAKEGIQNVEIITDDILKLLTSNQLLVTSNYRVVANIPYYLTSRLLRLLLENENRPELIVMTLQKEVAGRLIAKPPQMNLLALSVQAHGTPKIIHDVPASCFSPRPKVDSAIVHISDISDRFFEKNGLDKKLFFEIAKQGFSQKRKILSNTLKKFGIKNLPFALSRPQELSLNDWAKITQTIEAEPL